MRYYRSAKNFLFGGILCVAALVCALFFPEVRAPLPRGTVIAVADGDSLEIAAGDGSHRRARLYGVDCPESRQEGGSAATAFAESLAAQSVVETLVMDTDRYDRDVVIVTLPDGRVLNEELVRAGHAWVYRQHCKAPQCASWNRLEEQARREKRGLWGKAGPEPPWRWRGRHPRQER